VLPITEVNGLTTKKVKWGTATSSLKVINDALYSPIIGSASITTLGTITTGTWNADTLTVAKGGTGSTSLIAYQLLAGNGTGAVTTFGNGTSGYVLTSNGAGALPSFQNVGVTLNNNNTWTGANAFNYATTTFNSVAYKFPSADGASGQFLTTNGTGTLSWSDAIAFRYTVGSTTIASATTLEPTQSATPVLLKEIKISSSGSGTVDVQFDLKTQSDSASARIYKNGVAFGTERTTTSTSFVTYNEYLNVSPNDLIQIYVWGTGSYVDHSVQNMYIKASGYEVTTTTNP
jgi:hypothetical protein